MSTELEIRERQKNHLRVLLTLKKLNPSSEIVRLDDFVREAIVPMSQEDIAWVEKIVGVSAID